MKVDSGQRQPGMNKRVQIFGFVLCAALFTLSRSVEAQRQKQARQIGFLMPVAAADAAPNIEAFRQGLRERGYVEGQDIAIESRFAAGKDVALSDLAAELVGLHVEVIVTWGTPATLAAKKATQTIPIVIAAAVDPVGTGLVDSLARPGGNVTGVSSGAADLTGKSLELLMEIAAGNRPIAVLWNRASPSDQLALKAVDAAAKGLGIQLRSFGVANPAELESAFITMGREHFRGLLVIHAPWLLANRKKIVEYAARARLPAVYERQEWAESGGLMSYGVGFPANFHRAAVYVDKILKGTKPANLPVEQPTKFELVINLKTAKQIGLTIPPNVLARADRVIR